MEEQRQNLKSAINMESEKKFLYWKDINLEIGLTKKDGCCKSHIEWKTLLKNVSGNIHSGEHLAIMGGSGAGKSTMLNIISGRFQKNKKTRITGEVKLNGETITWNKFKNIIGFVMQKDIFMEVLTVREIFEFIVQLRCFNISPVERKKKVDKMIQLMKLQRAENNRVGNDEQKGISGGEKRRLNIGVELLSDPQILFLDEPTSGLDSYTSYIIIKLLRDLASHGMMIVYTIHQPSLDIFNMFDKLLILNKGQINYFGKASDSYAYYRELGYQVPKGKNPIDFFINISIKANEEEQQRLIEFYN